MLNVWRVARASPRNQPWLHPTAPRSLPTPPPCLGHKPSSAGISRTHLEKPGEGRAGEERRMERDKLQSGEDLRTSLFHHSRVKPGAEETSDVSTHTAVHRNDRTPILSQRPEMVEWSEEKKEALATIFAKSVQKIMAV